MKNYVPNIQKCSVFNLTISRSLFVPFGDDAILYGTYLDDGCKQILLESKVVSWKL